MPTGPADLSAVEAALITVFVKKGVFKMFDEGTLTLDILEKGDQNSPRLAAMLGEVDGKKIKIMAHTAGNPNVGVGVGEKLGYPKAGHQEWGALEYQSQRLVSALSETAEMLSHTRTSAQSALRIAAREVEGILMNTRKQENLWALGDGSGLLATVTAGGWDETDTITVNSTANLVVGLEIIVRDLGPEDDAGIHAGTLPSGWDLTPATTGIASPAVVLTIPSSTTFTLEYSQGDGSITDISSTAAMDNMGIYMWDNQARVPWGLQNVCVQGNPSNHGWDPDATPPTDRLGMSAGFGAINRYQANDWWEPLTATAVGGAISIKEHIEPLEVNLVKRDTQIRKSSDVFFLSNQTAWYQVIHQLEAAKRTFTRTRIIEGKYEVVQNGIFTFGYDPQCPSGNAYIFRPAHLFRMILTPWGFERRGGSDRTQLLDVFNRPTSAWRGNLATEKQLVCSSVRGASTFTGIS